MPGKARLRIDRIYRAAEKAERFLPSAVDALIERIQNPKTKAKDLAACVARLAALADAKPRMEDDLGLVKKPVANQTLNVYGNITVQQLKAMTADEKEEWLVAQLSGRPVPALPAPEVVEA